MAIVLKGILISINKLQTMQNKSLTFSLYLDRLTATNKLHTHLNILKVSDLYKCTVLSFVNYTHLGKCPQIFENFFDENIAIMIYVNKTVNYTTS